MKDAAGRLARAVGLAAAMGLLVTGLVAPAAGAASVEIPGRRTPAVSAPGGRSGSVQADSQRGGHGWGDHRGRDGWRWQGGDRSHRPSHRGAHDTGWRHHHHGPGWGYGGWGHWGRPAPVWVPGSWIWGGWGWVWQPGYWR
jgi:hypothetical protein